MKKDEGSRRSFLKTLLAGSAVAATSALGANKVNAKEEPRKMQRDDILYKETEDFKRYYQSLKS